MARTRQRALVCQLGPIHALIASLGVYSAGGEWATHAEDSSAIDLDRASETVGQTSSRIQQQQQQQQVGQTSSRIHFGSCSLAQGPQPLWEHILARRPDVWIWGGDNVYADRLTVQWSPYPRAYFAAADIPHLRDLYAQQLAVPGYAKLLNSSISIVGTWDDHDYGINDGDKSFPLRQESQEAFLDFLGEPAGSPRRQQAGVYAARHFEFGSPAQSVLVVLLDLRYHRDPYSDQDGDFLGEEQWHWLDQTLAQSNATVHVFMSSLQLLEPRQKVNENWGRLPKARTRFLELLRDRKVAAPVVLSGDVHFAEISAAKCASGSILEVTSSGMTHSWGTRQPSGRTPPWVNAIVAGMFHVAQSVMPWRYQLQDAATGAQQYNLGLNFGELEFDWEAQALTVSLVGEGGQVLLKQRFALRDLGIQSLPCGPLRGEPEAWRVALGFGILAAVPLAALALVAAVLLCVFRSVRRLVLPTGDEKLKAPFAVSSNSECEKTPVPSQAE
ncbi:unnamed protein product [Polarella glacialis]|uniref:PhoD-like phosphatase metallophosphatase domain-containing protein n=1 Tax=Polarella glacialis TaxID=89957 RepID=A0A813GYA3_POLGL|nr:unnamed protein product [Polarella glacialis]